MLETFPYKHDVVLLLGKSVHKGYDGKKTEVEYHRQESSVA